MLTLEGFPPPALSPCIITIPRNAVSQFLLLPNKTHRTHLSFCSIRKTQLCFSAVLSKSRTGYYCVNALKSRRKGGNSLVEMDGVDEGFEDDDDEFDDIDYGDEDEDDIIDDNDEELFIPLRSMKKWVENKPSGFGEGKVYDTSFEDKLLEEMELSKEAQIANINELKNNPPKPNSDNEVVPKQKALEVLPIGIRVRLLNLPKKKKIHRDLQLAFKGVPGIVNIVPVVLGNKKTRDPICKGIAFVDFKSEDEAYRFVQLFSRQSIAFGKIQKQIKCEIVSPNSPNTANKQSANGTHNLPILIVNNFEDDPDADSGSSDIDDPSVDLSGENDKNEGADDDIGEDLVYIPSSEHNSGNVNMEPRIESSTKSSSPEQQKKIQATGKKPVTKRKVQKVPKLNIPGSANRLKIKEKSVLTDVFSKYGLKAASAGKQQG